MLWQRTNETMVPSGHVFCYPCVFNYVSAHKRCPATASPMGVSQLRRIYRP